MKNIQLHNKIKVVKNVTIFSNNGATASIIKDIIYITKFKINEMINNENIEKLKNNNIKTVIKYDDHNNIDLIGFINGSSKYTTYNLYYKRG